METHTTFVMQTFPVPLGLRLQQNKTEIICIKDAERWLTNATHCLWSASSSSPKSLSFETKYSFLSSAPHISQYDQLSSTASEHRSLSTLNTSHSQHDLITSARRSHTACWACYAPPFPSRSRFSQAALKELEPEGAEQQQEHLNTFKDW